MKLTGFGRLLPKRGSFHCLFMCQLLNDVSWLTKPWAILLNGDRTLTAPLCIGWNLMMSGETAHTGASVQRSVAGNKKRLPCISALEQLSLLLQQKMEFGSIFFIPHMWLATGHESSTCGMLLIGVSDYNYEKYLVLSWQLFEPYHHPSLSQLKAVGHSAMKGGKIKAVMEHSRLRRRGLRRKTNIKLELSRWNLTTTKNFAPTNTFTFEWLTNINLEKWFS